MPNIDQMTSSKFLRKEDCDPPILVTIDRIVLENVGLDDQPKESKWCLYFLETEKGIVTNPTNRELCAEVCGSRMTEDWRGHKIVLFNDPSIMYQGRRTGGIRIRAPKNSANTAAVKRMLQPILTDMNRKLQDAADETEFQRHGADAEF